MREGSRRYGSAPPRTQRVKAPAASYRSHGRGFGSPCSAAAVSRPGSAVTGNSQAMPSGAESTARKTRKDKKITRKEEKNQARGGSRGPGRARSAAGSFNPLFAPQSGKQRVSGDAEAREPERRQEARRPHKMAAARARRRVWETPAHPRRRGQDPDLRADLFVAESRRAGTQGLRHDGGIGVRGAKGRRHRRNSRLPAALGFGSAARVGGEPWRGPGWSPAARRERRRGFLEGREAGGIACHGEDKAPGPPLRVRPYPVFLRRPRGAGG